MTVRQARKVWAAWKASDRPMLWPEEIEAVDTLLRALDRPTRLEREAARIIDLMVYDLRNRSLGYYTEARWLRAYERKRKGAKRAPRR